jgi:Uma2 family endonuclease
MSTATAIQPSPTPPAMTAPTKIRAEDFLKMDLGEGLHELVDGEIILVPPAEYAHGFVCGRAYLLFEVYGRTTNHGHAATNDSLIPVNEFNVRGADVQYFREARWSRTRIGLERPPVPPDLVVEVVSPSDRNAKLLRKVSSYLEAGVSVVLVLNPAQRTLTIYRGDTANSIVLNESATLENLPELPDFRCQVSEFFS